MRSRAVPFLAVFALGLAGSLAPARGDVGVVPDRIRFARCEEVFAFVTVPEANVSAHLPEAIEPAVVLGGVDVQLRTARCDTTIDGVTSDGLSSEIGISIEPPDGRSEEPIHLIRYQLSWSTNDQAYASWVKRGTDLDGVVHFTKTLGRTSAPGPAGVDRTFSFESPAPAAWEFSFDAVAVWPRDNHGTEVTVDIYRQTSEGLVRFRAESRPPDPGDRISGADIVVTVRAGTALANLLAGARACTAEGETIRCDANALVHGYAVEIEDQPFTKTIVRPPADAAAALAEAREATRKYTDVSQALADGYIPLGDCVEDPDNGAMGIHFYSDELASDVHVDHRRPEMLLYLPRDGALQLVGIEYLVDHAQGRPRPELFGQPFGGPMDGHNPLQSKHYDLHVWPFEWASNPAGTFAQYNPDLRCVPEPGP